MDRDATIKPLKIKVTDMHTGGEPLRIVDSGYPPIHGDTIMDKRSYMKNNLDYVRTFLMLEPRGHHEQYGAVLVAPDDPSADIGVIFIHNEGYSTMCGHAVIALGRYVVDRGLNKCKQVTREGKEVVDTFIQCPCGLVKATVDVEDGVSGCVSFVSVPAFLAMKDVVLETEEYGSVYVDISYGGAFYVSASSVKLGLDIRQAPVDVLVHAATILSSAAKKQVKLNHPDHKDLGYIYGTILTDDKDQWSASEPTANLCVFADHQVDRSPTGSGVTARIAIQYFRNMIGLGQRRAFLNVKTGSQFYGTAHEETCCGPHKAIRVQVTGRAFYTGECTFSQEIGDDMKYGFSVR